MTDPTQPGFEAFLEPTPTLLLLHASGTRLVSVAVLALNSGDAGGSVLVVPPDTRLDSSAGADSLGGLAAFLQSPTAMVTGLRSLIGIGVSEVIVVDDARWAELVAPVAPLTIQNPDTVGEFPAGPLTLEAEQVGPYLDARAEGESELARPFRQQLFFEAWADAVAASSAAAAVPGEVESGIGRFMRGVANGPRQIATLPVVESIVDSQFGELPRLDVDAEGAQELIARSCRSRRRRRPAVESASDCSTARATPSTCSGSRRSSCRPARRSWSWATPTPSTTRPPRSGTTTRRSRSAAEDIRDALGTGRVVDDPRQTDAFDVTIVLGTDV